MKKFLLFAGINYYPPGGWDDFISAHETEEDARCAAKRVQATYHYEWFELVDAETLTKQNIEL